MQKAELETNFTLHFLILATNFKLAQKGTYYILSNLAPILFQQTLPVN